MNMYIINYYNDFFYYIIVEIKNTIKKVYESCKSLYVNFMRFLPIIIAYVPIIFMCYLLKINIYNINFINSDKINIINVINNIINNNIIKICKNENNNLGNNLGNNNIK